MSANTPLCGSVNLDDQPLNLCIRDGPGGPGPSASSAAESSENPAGQLQPQPQYKTVLKTKRCLVISIGSTDQNGDQTDLDVDLSEINNAVTVKANSGTTQFVPNPNGTQTESAGTEAAAATNKSVPNTAQKQEFLGGLIRSGNNIKVEIHIHVTKPLCTDCHCYTNFEFNQDYFPPQEDEYYAEYASGTGTNRVPTPTPTNDGDVGVEAVGDQGQVTTEDAAINLPKTKTRGSKSTPSRTTVATPVASSLSRQRNRKTETIQQEQQQQQYSSTFFNASEIAFERVEPGLSVQVDQNQIANVSLHNFNETPQDNSNVTNNDYDQNYFPQQNDEYYAPKNNNEPMNDSDVEDDATGDQAQDISGNAATNSVSLQFGSIDSRKRKREALSRPTPTSTPTTHYYYNRNRSYACKSKKLKLKLKAKRPKVRKPYSPSRDYEIMPVVNGKVPVLRVVDCMLQPTKEQARLLKESKNRSRKHKEKYKDAIPSSSSSTSKASNLDLCNKYQGNDEDEDKQEEKDEDEGKETDKKDAIPSSLSSTSKASNLDLCNKYQGNDEDEDKQEEKDEDEGKETDEDDDAENGNSESGSDSDSNNDTANEDCDADAETENVTSESDSNHSDSDDADDGDEFKPESSKLKPAKYKKTKKEHCYFTVDEVLETFGRRKLRKNQKFPDYYCKRTGCDFETKGRVTILTKLRSHYKLHLYPTLFECKLCRRKYQYTFSLGRHMKEKHPKKARKEEDRQDSDRKTACKKQK